METLKQTVDVELITKYSTRLQVRILPPELILKQNNHGSINSNFFCSVCDCRMCKV